PGAPDRRSRPDPLPNKFPVSYCPDREIPPRSDSRRDDDLRNRSSPRIVVNDREHAELPRGWELQTQDDVTPCARFFRLRHPPAPSSDDRYCNAKKPCRPASSHQDTHRKL